jgi:hypothetical protein
VFQRESYNPGGVCGSIRGTGVVRSKKMAFQGGTYGGLGEADAFARAGGIAFLDQGVKYQQQIEVEFRIINLSYAVHWFY